MTLDFRKICLIAAALLISATSALAQTPAARSRPRAAALRVIVRTQSGDALPNVRVVVQGSNRDASTDTNGVATFSSMADGAHRLLFEREGFISLEREVTMKAGRPSEVEVALSAAPAPPPPPPVVEAPRPPPVPPPPPPVANEPPTFVSIPMFLDKNLIGRDPLKESVLACTASGTTRILQLREAIGEHAHADLDEALYVVAGEADIRVKEQSNVAAPGSLVVIPRGQSHTIARKGKNPAILLSILSGAPCRAATRN